MSDDSAEVDPVELLRQITRWQREQTCELCSDVSATSVNGRWFCPTHIDAGLTNVVEVEAMSKGLTVHIDAVHENVRRMLGELFDDDDDSPNTEER